MGQSSAVKQKMSSRPVKKKIPSLIYSRSPSPQIPPFTIVVPANVSALGRTPRTNYHTYNIHLNRAIWETGASSTLMKGDVEKILKSIIYNLR